VRSLRGLIVVGFVATAAACGSGLPAPKVGTTPFATLRIDGRASTDGEYVGRWALSEMIAPGGDAAQGAIARERLAHIKHDGLYGSLARAIADQVHGQPKTSADAYVDTLSAARSSRDPDAPLIAWFASHNLRSLRGSVTELYAAHRAALDGVLEHPENLGWRAVAELEEWRAAEVFDKAEATGEAYDALVTKRLGCAGPLRIAGPFGHGSPGERRQSFDAERPGPWPVSWPIDPLRGTVAHQLKTEQHRCLASSTEAAADGVFYTETFFTTKGDRDLLVAVQSSVKVWIDDAPVLARDPRDWGSWQRFGVAVSVHEGRHRVLARVLGASSSVRLLNLDGTSAGIETDADATQPYVLAAPRELANPNPIDAIVTARETASPLQALLASYAAHAEALDDVASVLAAPIARPNDAAAVALLHAADVVMGDPALPEDARQRDAKEMRERAAQRDPKLWFARLALIVEDGEQRGPVETVTPLRALADEFKNVPQILEQLARVYTRLAWRGERMRALAELASRFPDDVSALRMYLDAIEEDGAVDDADKIAARIKKLDPDAEVDLDRAVARHDWKEAIAELQRLGKRRPERKEIATRIADVLARSGDPRAAAEQLTRALVKHPLDSAARFRIADRAYAKGDTQALRHALAEALQVGASGAEIRAAIDLLEGATDLEPYRVDGRAVIREFEAWRKGGHEMEGTAARVLDYAATWIHPDGSSEMLEHEIQRIQSQEAINKEAEIPPPTGLVLRLRVIKPNGETLEPEQVAGKPTLTMPHLEVGDYIEMEHITPQAGDGQRGKRYRGPHWFFREPEKGYWRSAFVVIAPKDKALQIETYGNVGQDTTKELGTFVQHRWQVDQSPPAIVEPDSPPANEFLPSVRVGWGIALEDWIARLVDAATDETPLDPRMQQKALEIVRGAPSTARDERARLLYRFVLDNVQDGKETDGRRVLTGRAGSRQAAYHYLLRLLGIPSELAVVKSRIASPPIGKMSEIEVYDGLVLRVETERGVRWLLVRDKFAPYGYVPADMRGQPCFRLVPGNPKDTVSATGAVDGIIYAGRADVRENGSATMDLALTFSGNRGIAARGQLDQIPEGRLLEFVEKEVIATTFDGGHARDLKVENRTAVDQPLTLRIRVEVPQMAKVVNNYLSLKSLFPLDLSELAALPQRQTPLLRRGSYHTEVHFDVVFPESMKMPASLPIAEVKHGDAIVVVKDAVHGHAIHLDRVVDLPAGRVQPGDDYARYRAFSRDADALLEREILIGR
jgi:tetratricopeptide (TPR) repeat protein